MFSLFRNPFLYLMSVPVESVLYLLLLWLLDSNPELDDDEEVVPESVCPFEVEPDPDVEPAAAEGVTGVERVGLVVAAGIASFNPQDHEQKISQNTQNENFANLDFIFSLRSGVYASQG